MAKGGAMRTLMVFGLGAGAVLWAGNAANPGSSTATVQAGVTAGDDLISGAGLLGQSTLRAATPLISDARNAIGASGLGNALSAPTDGTQDPTAVPPKAAPKP